MRCFHVSMYAKGISDNMATYECEILMIFWRSCRCHVQSVEPGILDKGNDSETNKLLARVCAAVEEGQDEGEGFGLWICGSRLQV